MSEVKILKPGKNGVLVEVKRIQASNYLTSYESAFPVVKGKYKNVRRVWRKNA